jgi:hypothetical protein
MKNLVLWIILACAICLGAAGLIFFLIAAMPQPGTAFADSEARTITSLISGGICLVAATVLLMFTGIMFKLSK